MTMYRAPLALLLGTFMTVGCWQQLDQNASSGITQVNVDPAGGIGAKFPIETETPAIGETALDNGDPDTTAKSGCDKDAFDGQQMLSEDCDGCHHGRSDRQPEGDRYGSSDPDRLEAILEHVHRAGNTWWRATPTSP